jgi:hypothetical protein
MSHRDNDGVTKISLMAFSITTDGIMALNIMGLFAHLLLCFVFVMLRVIMLSAVILSVVVSTSTKLVTSFVKQNLNNFRFRNL